MNIRLRAIEKRDIKSMYVWDNDRSLWGVTGYNTPFSMDALASLAESSMRGESIYQSGQIRLIIDVDEVAVGCVDLFEFEPRDRRIGVGILVYDNALRGQGIATQALNLTMEYCGKILNVENIWAYIPLDNCASLGLFEKCGFSKSGTLRRWRLYDGVYGDVAVYQHLKL